MVFILFDYVCLSAYCSAFAPVHSGVPQGPLLITMHIKTLSAIIDSHSIIHHSFADDLQLQMSPLQIEYLSYFNLCSHVCVMPKLGQMRTCLDIMTVRQNSCLSPLKELSICMPYLLQSLSAMIKFPSNSL